MDDDFGADEDFLSALAASEKPPTSTTTAAGPSRPAPPPPPPNRVRQPAPQRLDRPPPPKDNNTTTTTSSSSSSSGVKQPTPQALPQRAAGSSILVSPRQKGNPVLACLKSLPWEYSDIPADYGLGQTTCALFLSLKYHRLHPEYIYSRIRNLHNRYNLRVLLALVDIPNGSHEDILRELAKTSLVSSLTLVLAWSAAEAARYLELFKSYEHASPAAIRAPAPAAYAERLVGFVTAGPGRRINRADAVALVGTFGSLRAAVNADPDTVASVVGGWGERKVRAWCGAVAEPFRPRPRAAAAATRSVLHAAVPLARVPARETAGAGRERERESQRAKKRPRPDDDDDDDQEEAMLAAAIAESKRTAAAEKDAAARARGEPHQEAGSGSASSASGRGATAARKDDDDELGGGVAAALARLRQGG